MTQGRNKEELQDITLLGNQNNKYEFDYTPKYSKLLIINIKEEIIL